MMVEIRNGRGTLAGYCEGQIFINNMVSTVKCRLSDSPVCKDLLQVRPVYLKGTSITIRDGAKTLFWSHSWIDHKPLCVLHPVLFELAL